MIQIIPAILAISEVQYEQDLNKLSSCEALKIGWVHIDFADNKFVQNQTIDPEVIKKFPTNFRKEAHLMVSHPKEWVDKLAEAGFKRIIFHLESEDDPREVIDNIKNKGLEVGIAIKNETDIEGLSSLVDKLGVVLIMGIIPGFQGQPFIPETLDKIKKLKSKGWQVKIGVDGAVRDTNIKEIMESGADFVIMGSYLLKGHTDENLEKLWVEVSK